LTTHELLASDCYQDCDEIRLKVRRGQKGKRLGQLSSRASCPAMQSRLLFNSSPRKTIGDQQKFTTAIFEGVAAAGICPGFPWSIAGTHGETQPAQRIREQRQYPQD